MLECLPKRNCFYWWGAVFIYLFSKLSNSTQLIISMAQSPRKIAVQSRFQQILADVQNRSNWSNAVKSPPIRDLKSPAQSTKQVDNTFTEVCQHFFLVGRKDRQRSLLLVQHLCVFSHVWIRFGDALSMRSPWMYSTAAFCHPIAITQGARVPNTVMERYLEDLGKLPAATQCPCRM